MSEIVFDGTVVVLSMIVCALYGNSHKITFKGDPTYLDMMIACLTIPLIEELVFRIGIIYIIDIFTTNVNIYWISHLLFALAHIRCPSTIYKYSEEKNVYVVFGIFYGIRFIQLYYFGKLCIELTNVNGFMFTCMFHILWDILIITVSAVIKEEERKIRLEEEELSNHK
jgi:hypothetical protein